MGAIAGILTSAIAGGATGLFGIAIQSLFSFASNWLRLKADKQQFDHDEKMKQADAEIMKQEWAARTQIAATEGQTAQTVSANQAFAGSVLKEPERYAPQGVQPDSWWTKLLYWNGWMLLTLVDVVRGLIRPALTAYLAYITTSIWFEVRRVTNLQQLSPDQAMQILLLVVDTILYLTTTCVTWWFGTRNVQVPPTLRRGDQETKPS